MAKKRLYEVAKELGKTSNEVINVLAKQNVTKSNFSALEDKEVELIRRAFAPATMQKPASVVKPVFKLVRKAEPRVTAEWKAADAQKNGRSNGHNQNNNGRPQQQNQNRNQGKDFGQNRGQGNRSQGQNRNQNQNRNQGRDFGQNKGQGNRQQGQNRGQGFEFKNQGQNRNQNQNQNRNQNFRPQGQKSNGQKPFNKDNNRFNDGGQRPDNRGPKNTKAQERKKIEHTFISERERSDRNRERNREFNKNFKDKKFEGSYATKESRPNRSKGHEVFPNQPKKEQPVKEVVRPTSVEVGESINVKEFAQLIKRDVSEVIKKLFLMGMMVTINQDIDFDTAALVGDEFECEVTQAAPPEDPTEIPEVEDDPAKREPRPPVVTVMGHVDHGKTSLLDAIRKTNVTAKEAGGITQRIGAYKVNYNGKTIVFLDTPGHEAFTAMRARGAQVTDVAVLVVAADDGVMPQTIEAINHAKAAKVPIIVAINKMDKLTANPEHVKQQLAEHELVPEDWGGDTIMVPVSAFKKEGITDLLEMIQLVADMGDLKANPNLPAHGTIIEAQLDKGRGPVATVLVQRGTLNVGDTIIAGTCYGKVRAMVNDRGEKVKKAPPSTPVEVLGLNDVPQAGDVLDATEERIARSVAEKRVAKQREGELKTAGKVSLDDLFQRIQEGEIKDLNIVVKADVQGSIEALKQSLEKIKNDEVKVVVVHSGVGAITESDVMLASAANAFIIGFNVRPDANARKAADVEKVDMRMYRVIYDALNDVEAAIKGMLAPKFKEVIQGRVEVRQIIRISKLVIAGCYVTEGKVTNNSKVRVVRDGIVIHEGEIDSLRRFKDDVKEVQQSFECGITLENFTDLRENDQFEIFTMEETTEQQE